MRTSRPRLTASLAILGIALLVGACAASGVPAPVDTATNRMSISESGGAPQNAGISNPVSVALSPDQATSVSPNTVSSDTVTGPMIVRNGTLDLIVADVDAGVAGATKIVSEAGGYVAGSTRAYDGDRPIATLTLRIPADRWEATLASLRGIATKVSAEQTNATEVTSQVVDLDARLVNLRATEAALLAIMEKAVRVTDILEVQSQLTTTRGGIEQLVAERKNLADQAAQGTLIASFALAPTPVTTVTSGWDPGAIAADATAQLISVGQALVGGVIWVVIVWLPILLVLLVLCVPAFFVGRRLVRRTKRGKTKTDAATTDGALWGDGTPNG